MTTPRSVPLLASALMIAGSVAFAPSASAAGSVSSIAIALDAAPSCVKVVKQGRNWTQPWVDVKNTCKTSKRVKVVWAYGPDSPCTTIKPGKTYHDQSGALARFDGLERC